MLAGQEAIDWVSGLASGHGDIRGVTDFILGVFMHSETPNNSPMNKCKMSQEARLNEPTFNHHGASYASQQDDLSRNYLTSTTRF